MSNREAMINANLIPAGRRKAKRRRARLRIWIGACIAYGTVLLVAYTLCDATWGTDDRTLDEELERTAAVIVQSNSDILALRGTLDQARLALEANRSAGNQPDWSALLALLARSLDDELVLSQCRLISEQVAARGPAKAPPNASLGKPTRFTLRISGFGRSQAAVSRFVLRLERADLFSKVSLISTGRESFLTGKAIAFLVECSLQDEVETSW